MPCSEVNWLFAMQRLLNNTPETKRTTDIRYLVSGKSPIDLAVVVNDRAGPKFLHGFF